MRYTLLYRFEVEVSGEGIFLATQEPQDEHDSRNDRHDCGAVTGEIEQRQANEASRDQRRRAVARVVPVPQEDGGESMALVILLVSATIAIVASTLATALF